MAWTLTLLVLAIFLVWPIVSFYQNRGQGTRTAGGFHADSLWLSGPLSQSHVGLASNCQACHVEPFQPVQDSACKACHVNISDHAALGQMRQAMPELGGFRHVQQVVGNAFGQTAGRCVECHTEHEGAQQMVPAPQQFCADCHTDLRARVRTPLANASDFRNDHPQFRPLVMVRWDGGQPIRERVGLDQQPREQSNLKFRHDLHLGPLGGAARAALANGIGARLECSSCHTPTQDGIRFEPVNMERNCGSCHSLSFDVIGGTIRRLRHGSPEQVIADIRGLYRAGGPASLVEFSPGTRVRPGTANEVRAAVQFARARAGAQLRGERAIHAIFSGPRGTCFECHTIIAPAPGTLNYRIEPVRFTERYLEHGWFDHRPHQITHWPDQRGQLQGSRACASCHTQVYGSDDARDIMLPGLGGPAGCQVCHGGERSATRGQVPSTCAMCHDYHMDRGVPAARLQQTVRGQRRESTVAQPQAAPGRGRR